MNDPKMHDNPPPAPDDLVKLIESSLRQIFPDLCYDDGRPDLWLDAAVTLTKAHREADQRRIAELEDQAIKRGIQCKDLELALKNAEAALKELREQRDREFRYYQSKIAERKATDTPGE